MTSTDIYVDNIITRATSLGDHSTLCQNVAKRKLTRKPMNFVIIEKQKFEDTVGQIGVLDCGNVIMFAVSVSDAL